MINWLLALAFYITENRFFGWNATPQTPEELICDGIVFALVAIAWKSP
jgi:hypothetical protein